MRRLLVAGLLLCSLSFAGEGHEHEHKKEHEEEIHMTEDHIKQLGIKLYTVRKQPAGRLIKIPAEVEENPLLSYEIYSPVEGIIRKLYVKEGDFVKKGQVLAEIYSPELADLIGEVQMAKVRMESAKKVYERDKALYSQKVIPYTRYFTSMVEYERAKGEYTALSERLKSYGEIRNYNLLIRSPGTGYVVEQNVVLGDSVGLDRRLFSVHHHEIMWVYGWADERSAREIREGIRAMVLANGEEIPCKVDYIGHEVDIKTRRVKIRCVAKNRKHLLKPGMFVSLMIRTGGRKALMIPKRAIQEIEGKPVVFVRTDEGFEPRTVHISKELNGYVVIEEGLKEGEKVAISGTVFLKTKLVGVEEGGHAH